VRRVEVSRAITPEASQSDGPSTAQCVTRAPRSRPAQPTIKAAAFFFFDLTTTTHTDIFVHHHSTGNEAALHEYINAKLRGKVQHHHQHA
jgi:hypothetical protein